MDALLPVLINNLKHPLTILLITLGIYQLAETVFIRLGRKGWLHPLITSSICIYLIIKWTPLDLQTYLTHSEILKTLLAPFTVALAVPLSSQMQHLRTLAGPLIGTLILGGILAGAAGVGIAWVSGGTPDILLALSPKAVTTAVAMVMAEQLGAIVPLVVSAVVVSGIFGGLIGPSLCKAFGITDPRAIGFAMGINAHAVGTARSFEIDVNMGAYASLGMSLNAIFTPMLLPIVIHWLM
ncbi:LrgB family protein [Endozoicomonas sp. Mp262]|uniref:LrgB family protein n=1 Tax=Endozoicomonas sp. Mp262 TaxID=2919499 RepID=UPI0021DB1B23